MNILTPVIPEYITVHLGRPADAARNVTVPFADYIKNVASSEIYPTWNESAIRANIYAEISFALNRIFTEYYRSRGYDFDITNSTAFDQSYVYGRDIFENISQLVDEIFNSYVSRQGAVEPLFTSYCDGVRVQCNGLSQWGSEALASEGYTPYSILQYYYGDNIDIVREVPVAGVEESYPGRALSIGSVGDSVRFVQIRLNRISKNYPGIPKISEADGIYDSETEDAVREFQRQFSLTPDGIVGKATWYAVERIYNAVKRTSDVNAEGIPAEDLSFLFSTELSEGMTGYPVRELQYLLAVVGSLNDFVREVAVDGIFGRETRAAVEDFQQAYGLPVTGIVNNSTWNALFSTYRNLINSLPEGALDELTPIYPGVPLVVGSTGESVRIIQDYLNRISDTYTSIPKVTVDGAYGMLTENAVRAYQRTFGLTQTGTVAAQTWQSIVSTYRTLTEGESSSSTQFGGTLSR